MVVAVKAVPAAFARIPRRLWAFQRGWLTVLFATVALTAVMILHPAPGPPLYDGVGFPDEPYRWLDPPPGAPKTSAVTPATVAQELAGLDVVPGFVAASAEDGPQVSFDILPGALRPPPGATTLQVQATAVRPPSPAPDHGSYVSNVYSLAATADTPGTVELAPRTLIGINMRSDKETPDPVVLEEWQLDGWSQRATSRVGRDIYAAQISSLTQFALVKLHPGDVPSPVAGPQPGAEASSPTQINNSSITATTLWISLGSLAAVLAVALLLIRRRLTRREPPS
jgi:hypothetical protein